MIERDTCYFCTSPFQLYAILSLTTERKEKADLYIDPQFLGAEEFAERIKKLDFFINVSIIRSEDIYQRYFSASSGFKNHLQIAKSYLHTKEIAAMILLADVRYHNIFVSSKAYLPRMVYLSYLKQGYDFNFYYFDDGAGTYCNDRAYKPQKADLIIRRLLLGKKAVATDHKRYVFSPEIFSSLNRGYDVERIVRVWEQPKGKEMMNFIFGNLKNVTIKEHAIILDQPRDVLFDEVENKRMVEVYKLLVEKLGYDNVLLKKHPRSKMQDGDKIKSMQETSVPFETYCLNMNMNQKIIVTYSSTGAATPKILFDQEPIVIVLSKLFTTNKGEKNMFEEFYISVKEAYSDPDRFYIPENTDELMNIIRRLQ